MIKHEDTFNEYSEKDKKAISNLLHALNNLPEGIKIETERDILSDQEIIDGCKSRTSSVRVVEHCYGSHRCDVIASVHKNIVF